jgi:hypothetical protein
MGKNRISSKNLQVRRRKLKVFLFLIIIVTLMVPVSYLGNIVWGTAITVLTVIFWIQWYLWWRQLSWCPEMVVAKEDPRTDWWEVSYTVGQYTAAVLEMLI